MSKKDRKLQAPKRATKATKAHNRFGIPAGAVTSLGAAFWRNDVPEGIGVQIPSEMGEELGRVVLASLSTWDEYASKEDIEAQMFEFARESKTRELTQEEGFVILVNIAWLESRGHLQPDEYNGCVWMHAYNVASPA